MKRVKLTPVFIVALLICVALAYLLSLKFNTERHHTYSLFSPIVAPAQAK